MKAQDKVSHFSLIWFLKEGNLNLRDVDSSTEEQGVLIKLRYAFFTDHWTLGDVHARSQSYRLKEHRSTDHPKKTVLRCAFLSRCLSFVVNVLFLFISMAIWEANYSVWIFVSLSKLNNSVTRHSLYFFFFSRCKGLVCLAWFGMCIPFCFFPSFLPSPLPNSHPLPHPINRVSS